MVTARLAIGSVSTLALGALVLGSAPYWLHRGAGGAHVSPWGVVSALDVQPAAAQADEQKTQLLKLAALKSGAPSEPAAASAVAAPVQAAEPTPVAASPVAQSLAAPVPSAMPDAPAAPPVASVEQHEADAPQQLASAEVPDAVETARDDASSKSDRININTASPTALDHLPGGGRIGRTIVSHRPYKNVKDLVSRRVLRTSDFQKIQSHISVD